MTTIKHVKKSTARPTLKMVGFGILDDIVNEISRYTEANRAVLLFEILIAAGSSMGPAPFLAFPGNPLRTNLFGVVIGNTASGRKGTAWGQVNLLFEKGIPDWIGKVHQASPSSGPALIQLLADNPFDSDRERLLRDDEFSRTLATTVRDPKLSGNFRLAWENKTLTNDAITNQMVAHNPHLSVIGDITPDEILKHLEREKTTGFWNRFLFAYSERSKVIVWPEGEPDLTALGQMLAATIEAARAVGPVLLDDTAMQVYKNFREDVSWEEGPLSDFYARRAPMVLKLALVLSLLNHPEGLVTEADMIGALALWEYSAETLRYLTDGSLAATPEPPTQGVLIPQPLTVETDSEPLTVKSSASQNTADETYGGLFGFLNN